MFRFNLVTISTLIGVMALSTTPGFSQAPRSGKLTVFKCAQYGRTGHASIATRGNLQSEPMIIWTQSYGGYSSLQRCNIVNNRLNRAIATTDQGTLSNLYLTYGRVGRATVICYVNGMDEGCTNENLLFTLRPQDRGKELTILEQVAHFGTLASGSPIQQSRNRYYAPLGQAIEKAFEPKPSQPAQGGQ